MAEYIEREKAIEEISAWATNLNNPKTLVTEDALCVLNLIPTTDVQPVVRCKDCKFYDGVHEVHGFAPCIYWTHMTLWDDYCSHGVREDGEA